MKPHVLLNDEFHVHKSGETRDAIIRGMHKRKQPLAIDITTEGRSESSPLGLLQAGFYESPHVEHVELTPYLHSYSVGRSMMIRWGIPWGTKLEDVDLENPELVRACTPASWIDVDDLIRDQLLAPGKRAIDFATYHCNMLVEGEESGISPKDWDACGVDGLALPDGAEVDIAVDIGWRRDSSAVVAAGPLGERLALDARIWDAPGGDKEINLWATVDVAVEEMMRRYNVRRLRIDPYSDTSLRQEWLMRGWPVEEFPQIDKIMIGASQLFLQGVESGRVAHDASDLHLREHVLNMRQRPSTRFRGWVFDKHPEDKRKSDGGRATIMACEGWLSDDGGGIGLAGI
jgi:phage terminase large subunit-like protein